MKKLATFTILTLLEGIISLAFLLKIPGDPKNAFLFGYSLSRIAMLGSIVAIVLFLLCISFSLVRKNRWAYRIQTETARLSASPVSIFILFTAFGIGISLGTFFILAYFWQGEKYLEIFRRLTPLVIFVTIFCLQSAYALRTQSKEIKPGYLLLKYKILQIISQTVEVITHSISLPPYLQLFIQKYKLRPIARGIVFILLAFLFLSLALDHAKTKNLDESEIDQGAYLDFTKGVYESGYKYTGDRNRMPVYPFIQAIFYDPSSSREEAFLRGKEVNVLLSFGLLLVLTWVISKFLPYSLTVIFILITSFGLYIFRAGYFQTELLFYFMFFLSFLSTIRMLIAPSIPLAILTGVLAAITHLTKASVLPLFVLFLGFYILKFGMNIFRAHSATPAQTTSWQPFILFVVIFILTVGTFLVVLYPYLRESKQIYGHYFYNVNSTFYMWYDRWGQAEEGTKAHGDRVGWPNMPAEDIPSFQKYMREHTPQQIQKRILNGIQQQIVNLTHPYSHFNYLKIYFVTLLFVTFLWWRKVFPLIKQHFFLISFVCATFISYMFLYAWYSAITGGHRFTLSLFMPMLFTCLFALTTTFKYFEAHQSLEVPLQLSRLFNWFNGVVLLLIFIDLAFFIPHALKLYLFAG